MTSVDLTSKFIYIFSILHVGSTRNWKILRRCDTCPSFIINVCSKNVWTYLGKHWPLSKAENNLTYESFVGKKSLSLAARETICWPKSSMPSKYLSVCMHYNCSQKNCTFKIKHKWHLSGSCSLHFGSDDSIPSNFA